MENDNTNGAENESNANSETSSQESNFPSQAEIQSRLKDILWEDVAEPQAEEGEADSNQPEDQQTEGESETDTNTETEGEEVHSKSEEEQEEEVSRGVQKRIDKLTAKRKEAEAEIEKLKNEVEALKQTTTTPMEVDSTADAFSNLNSLAEIEAEIAQARKVRNWAEENADGVSFTDEKGEEQYYDPAKLRQIKVNATRALEEGLPKRYQYIQARDQIDQIASVEYPWWKDKTSKEHQIANQFINAFPQIKRFPDYKMVIGDYIRGVKARETNKKGQNPIVKAPVQPRSNGIAPTVKKEEVRSQNAYAKFSKTGRTEDLADIIKNKFLD